MFVSACRISYSYTTTKNYQIDKKDGLWKFSNWGTLMRLSSSPASFQYNMFVILSSQLLVIREISINRRKRQSRTAEHVF